MQHLAPSQAPSPTPPSNSTRAASLGGDAWYPRDSSLPVTVCVKRAPWATSAEMQENWDSALGQLMTRLTASVEGLDASTVGHPAPGECRARAGVLECVEALDQLRRAMSSRSELQRTMDERDLPVAPTCKAPLESGDGAHARGIASNAGCLPQLAAERAHREMTDYMAVVAHELRNPLVPIRTAAALLGRARTEEIPRLRVIIERQVTRIAGLIADLVDIARLDSGKLRLSRQVVDMRAIVTEAVDDCRPAMNARLQHVEIDLPTVPMPVDGDPGRLVQIVCNLLDNASKYTPVAGRVGLSLTRVGDDLNLIVSDSGIGISAEALPRLFERFVQESRAADFNRAGLGIGLAVVRELVQAHGGLVEARSEGLGLGSRFIVTLPGFFPVQGRALAC